jgi:2-amino-4-hydroxy-6-hydroxymethyldihydropteridine diphosphokinase
MNLNHATVLAIGGNLSLKGAPLQVVLELALDRLPDEGLTVVKRSTWWKSAAWPDPSQPPFLNGVVLVRTELPARRILEALLGIETVFGRRRSEPNAPRTLDLDLIAHGREIINEPNLVVPHPRAAERLFVMGPLAEIAPDWRHPVLGDTAASLAARATVGADARPSDASE